MSEINQKEICCEVKPENDVTLHLGQVTKIANDELYKASLNDHIDCINNIFKKYKQFNIIYDNECIYVAIKQKHEETAYLLFKNIPDSYKDDGILKNCVIFDASLDLIEKFASEGSLWNKKDVFTPKVKNILQKYYYFMMSKNNTHEKELIMLYISKINSIDERMDVSFILNNFHSICYYFIVEYMSSEFNDLESILGYFYEDKISYEELDCFEFSKKVFDIIVNIIIKKKVNKKYYYKELIKVILDCKYMFDTVDSGYIFIENIKNIEYKITTSELFDLAFEVYENIYPNTPLVTTHDYKDWAEKNEDFYLYLEPNISNLITFLELTPDSYLSDIKKGQKYFDNELEGVNKNEVIKKQLWYSILNNILL